MRTAPLCVAAALVVACAPQRADDPVVARVGDEVLTIAQLLDQLPSGTSELEDVERRQFVERWIQQELLYQEALDRDLDRNARVQNLIKQARRDLLVAALLDSEFENRDVEITDDGISTYYYSHQEKFERAEDEVWAEHILLTRRRDANAVRQEVLQGDSFGDAAREHSLDRKSAKRGGDLGYFSVDDDPILWEACQKLTIDKLSKPVPTERGFHLIRVLSRMQAGSVRGIEHVRPQIVEALVFEDYRRRLDELTERLKSANSWLIDEGQLTSLGM